MIQEFLLLPSVEDYTTAHYFYPKTLRHPFAGGDMTTSLDFFRSSPGLTISIVVMAVLILYLVPKMQVRKVREKEGKGPAELENDYRQTLVQIFGGVAIIATVWAAVDNARIARESIDLTRQGQIADRTFKAMEMLSQPNNVDAKLAAIYALEQVANEDPKSEWQITETLYNYVLIHSNWSKDSFSKPPGGHQSDMRAIGNYLSRRPYRGEDDKCLEPHQCWDYEKGTPPRKERLEWDKRIINLPHVDLREVFLEGAMLKTANINNSHLEHGWLRQVHLENAYGQEVYLTGADLSDSYWLFANLKGAHLNEAQLCRARMQHVYAESADLENAGMENSNWSDSPAFRKANLKNANLNCTNWKGADMRDLVLDGASLFGADLTGAVHLTKEQLEKAHGDASTMVDASLRPANWSSDSHFQCPKAPARPSCP